ncbi:MAG: SpoIIE family protein phosphatase, partial [Acidobacteria bacterium]|nr:SpoIIE family protein phosphatase [Acidobacteriota bacterium]
FALFLSRRGLRKVLWRLRNRLYVAYLFIAVVPVVLIIVLVGTGIWVLTTQIAVYMVTSELDRRTASLGRLADALAKETRASRAKSIHELTPYVKDRFPNLEILIREPAGTQRFPEASLLEPPPAGFGNTGGLLIFREALCAWGHATLGDVEVTTLMPLNSDFLAQLVPGLGAVESNLTLEAPGPGNGPLRFKVGNRVVEAPLDPNGAKQYVPAAEGRLDFEVSWFSILPAAVWQAPGKPQSVVVRVTSRPSAVWRVLSAQKSAETMSGTYLPIVFGALAVLFFIMEIVALSIGVSLTRTITGAFHGIYTGTQQVMESNFSHRIEVTGNDQLAEVGRSFNQMTENLQRLVVVGITAGCNPARLVSGDYYDYQTIHGGATGIAIGDVAGKGISAALLMATLQSSLRTQLRACVERAAAVGGSDRGVDVVSTSKLVEQLNLHLYADTAPEKYATFFFGVYDDDSGLLVYTNAGHLPPVLVRNGEAIPLEVNGMVVGAFPFAQYGESRVEMQAGDLLVCYTDGITEPENEYGEMFGEDRVIDVVRRYADRDNEEIIAAIMESVYEWTASPELQDDMTLLLARRL